MKIHNDYMTVHTKQSREFMNITPNVKFAREKSGIRDGVILVSTLHANSAVFVNDEEPGLLQDVNEWLEKVAPQRDDYKHGSKFERHAGVHLQGILAHHQVVVPICRRKARTGPQAAGDLRGARRPATQAHSDQGPGRVEALEVQEVSR